ncbi:hypothetical protein [Streptomyces sp. NPDC048361]|uniref:hypothetical protein n=1 Tax=Streptomyces sp. NPDC048361 TaxID=3154720 RepID=UPI003424D4FE
MRTVAITGTRTTEHRPRHDYGVLFAAHLAAFTDGHFLIGGARGIDSLALEWLARSTDAHITVVVPGTLAQQPAEARHVVDRTRSPASMASSNSARPTWTPRPITHATGGWSTTPA